MTPKKNEKNVMRKPGRLAGSYGLLAAAFVLMAGLFFVVAQFHAQAQPAENAPQSPPTAETSLEVTAGAGTDITLEAESQDAPVAKPRPDSEPFSGGFQHELTIKTLDGRRYPFEVGLAIHPAEQEKGLMFVEEMPEMSGMLFVFGSEFVRSFWMRNTLIPLDIIFIEKDGRIQHIHHNAHPLDETMVTSGRPSYAVLELNGGIADKLEIRVGDYVFHESFRNRNLE